MSEKFAKFDKTGLGLSLGIIAPIITLVVVYLYSFDGYSVKEFFTFLSTMRVMTKLFSLCLLPNLLVFFTFIWGDLMRGARGVLMATILIAVIVMIIQFA